MGRLRLLIAKSAPEAMQDAVVALAVRLGGQTVLELLDQSVQSLALHSPLIDWLN